MKGVLFMQSARINYPNSLLGLTKDEIREKINSSIGNKLKHDIAIMYFVEEQCQIDIAIELNLSRSTINRKLLVIKEELS